MFRVPSIQRWIIKKKKKNLQPKGQCHAVRIHEHHFKNCFHTVLSFKLKTIPFSLYPWISQEQKEIFLNFFSFFPSTLGRARHGAKKEGDVTKEKKPTLFGFDGGKKERSNCIMYGGLNDVYRKRVFLWITAMGKTADLIKSTTHVDVPRLWQKGTLQQLGF